MGTTFITGIEIRPGRTPQQTAFDSISYITNPEKTRGGELVSSFRCDPRTAHFEMICEQHEFEQKTGRKVIRDYGGRKKSYLLMTIRQSFAPGEVTPEQAHEIGCELARRFLGKKYQHVVATHVDKHCVHNHITFNIVGSDLKKFRQTKFTPQHLRDMSDRLCAENGLTVVVPSVDWQKRKYTNERVTPFRTILKNDIDRCIAEASGYEDFLRRMEKMYHVSDTGKVLKFRHRTNGQQRPIRSYTLHKGYTRSEIRMRCEIDEEIINPVTISQKLRNIEAMIHAVGFIRENGSDFEAQSDKLQSTLEQTQKLMEQAKKKLDSAERIAKCFSVVEEYQSVYEQFEPGLLPVPTERRDEMELYQAAVKILQANHLSPENSSQEQFRAEMAQLSEKYSGLQKQYRSVQKQLGRVGEVQEISDRVEADDSIIATKKGGQQYGR